MTLEPTEGQRAVPILWLSIRARRAHAFLVKEARTGQPQSSLCGQVKQPTDDRWASPLVVVPCQLCRRRVTALRVAALLKEPQENR